MLECFLHPPVMTNWKGCFTNIWASIGRSPRGFLWLPKKSPLPDSDWIGFQVFKRLFRPVGKKHVFLPSGFLSSELVRSLVPSMMKARSKLFSDNKRSLAIHRCEEKPTWIFDQNRYARECSHSKAYRVSYLWLCTQTVAPHCTYHKCQSKHNYANLKFRWKLIFFTLRDKVRCLVLTSSPHLGSLQSSSSPQNNSIFLQLNTVASWCLAEGFRHWKRGEFVGLKKETGKVKRAIFPGLQQLRGRQTAQSTDPPQLLKQLHTQTD